MSTDAVGYILGLLTLGMSMVAARVRHMLMTLGTAALWVTFLNYMLSNNTAGSQWLELFVVAAYTFIALYALIFLVNRASGVDVGSARGSARPPLNEEGNESRFSTEAPKKRGLMDLTTEEYRGLVRRTLRPNRRRR